MAFFSSFKGMVSRIIVTLLGVCFIWGCNDGDTTQNRLIDTRAIISSQELYAFKCVACHGADGTLGLSGAKDLTISQLSRDDIRMIIANGKGAMADYKGLLKAEELDMLTHYVEGLKK